MHRKTISLSISLLLIAALISSCNMPREISDPMVETARIETSIARTVAANTQLTLQPDLESVEPPTNTPSDPGAEETDTPEPSETTSPTDTPSLTPLPCNLAEFVKDVTIPDGKKFLPGDTFTKTWRLRNAGSCAWTSGYEIVFEGGDAMGAPSAVQLTSGTVDPGDSVDVSVDLTAPGSKGTYRGNWQLRDPSDVVFGIENSSSGLFWVEIKVIKPTDTPTLTPTPSNTPAILIITIMPPTLEFIWP